MKNEDRHYSQWIEYRRQVSVPDSFPNNVMAGIERRSRAEEREWGRVSNQSYLYRPLARWCTGSGLVLLGLFRIFYVATSLLRTNLLMP